MFICVNRGGQCDSSDEAFITERLTQTLNRLGPLLARLRYGFSTKAQIKDDLSKNNILELCSDTSLIMSHVAAITSDTKGCECSDASMNFICSWYNRRWPALGEIFVQASVGLQGLFAQCCFDEILMVRDLPPLARQIESCLVDFAKNMNLTWTPLGNDAFKPDFEAQSSAFFQLVEGIEDVIDETPDNTRIWGKPRDELVIALEALNLWKWASPEEGLNYQ